MPKQKPTPMVVIVAAVPRGRGVRRRTVNPKMGAPYVVELPPCKPVVLVGDDEINAFSQDMASPTTETLRLSSEQAASLLPNLIDKAAADEISRLRQQVAALEMQLTTKQEPAAA